MKSPRTFPKLVMKEWPVQKRLNSESGDRDVTEATHTEWSGKSLMEIQMLRQQEGHFLARASAQNTELMLDVIKDFIKPDCMSDAREALRRAMWESKRMFFSQEEISKMARDAIATVRDINSVREPA